MWTEQQSARQSTTVNRRVAMRRLIGLAGDTRGQAMTEFVIMSALMVLVSAWLYHPDNTVFQGIRLVHDRTIMVVAQPGP